MMVKFIREVQDTKWKLVPETPKKKPKQIHSEPAKLQTRVRAEESHRHCNLKIP